MSIYTRDKITSKRIHQTTGIIGKIPKARLTSRDIRQRLFEQFPTLRKLWAVVQLSSDRNWMLLCDRLVWCIVCSEASWNSKSPLVVLTTLGTATRDLFELQNMCIQRQALAMQELELTWEPTVILCSFLDFKLTAAFFWVAEVVFFSANKSATKPYCRKKPWMVVKTLTAKSKRQLVNDDNGTIYTQPILKL